MAKTMDQSQRKKSGPKPIAKMTYSMLDFALFYASKGWRVLPVKPKSKLPAVTDWPNKATIEPNQLNEWFGNGSDYNIGLLMGEKSGIFALDVDPRHGGEETLLSLIADNGALPHTVEAQTGGGGSHIIFKHPGYQINNSANKLGPGLDIKADRGYILVAPSIHDRTGKQYEWELSSKPSQVSMSAAPSWLLKMITDNGHKVEVSEITEPKAISSGARNDTLASMAGAMRRKGFEADEIFSALSKHNQKYCSPPLPDDEIKIISNSVSRYAPAPTLTNNTFNQEITISDPATAYQINQEFNELLNNLEGRSIPTFIPAMDHSLGGLERQTLTMLAARPSMGKTTLAWQIARNVAAKGMRALFFSLEVSRASLWAKAACGSAGLRWRNIRSGEYTEIEMKRLLTTSHQLANTYADKLLTVDGMNTTQTIWRLVEDLRPDLVVVDHVRLIADQGEKENERLGAMSLACKNIAKQFNCAFLLLSQLNRSVEAQADKRPTLKDLRESGHLEENGDVILMMYRDQYYNPESNDRTTEILVRKFRDDVLNQRVLLTFNTGAQWFEDNASAIDLRYVP